MAKSTVQNLKDCITLNGINAFISWKAEVVKQTWYDDGGHAYTYTYPTYEYLQQLSNLGPFPKWDLTDPHSMI
jgi:hypothetical protein